MVFQDPLWFRPCELHEEKVAPDRAHNGRPNLPLERVLSVLASSCELHGKSMVSLMTNRQVCHSCVQTVRDLHSRYVQDLSSKRENSPDRGDVIRRAGKASRQTCRLDLRSTLLRNLWQCPETHSQSSHRGGSTDQQCR